MSDQNQLFKQIREGNMESLKQWLDQGGDVDFVRPGNKETLIMHAAMNGHAALVEYLMDHGADLSAQNSREHLPVTYAAKSGDDETVKLFLDRGYDVNADISGSGRKETFLHWASLTGSTKLVETLLSRGADVLAKDCTNRNALLDACSGGHLNIYTMLMQAGADLHLVDDHGNSALSLAASGGHTKLCMQIIHDGVDVKSYQSRSGKALTNAARESKEQTCFMLINQGAPIEGETLVQAVQNELLNVIGEILKKQPALIQYRGHLGMTALLTAAQYASVQVAKMLLAAGANINEIDDDKGWTALMHATYREHQELIDLLKKSGADEDIQDKSGKTAFDLSDDFYNYDD